MASAMASTPLRHGTPPHQKQHATPVFDSPSSPSAAHSPWSIPKAAGVGEVGTIRSPPPPLPGTPKHQPDVARRQLFESPVRRRSTGPQAIVNISVSGWKCAPQFPLVQNIGLAAKRRLLMTISQRSYTTRPLPF